MTATQWLKALYDAQYTMLYRLAASRLMQSVGNTEDIQDVLQDVFRLALEKDIRSHPNPVGWLIKATENICKTYAHKRLTENSRRHTSFSEFAQNAPVEPMIPVPSDESEADVLMMAESVLSPEEQRIFTAYFLENRPVESIAKEHGISTNALNVRIYRIRKRLQKIFSESL